jgi:hypothetical protein
VHEKDAFGFPAIESGDDGLNFFECISVVKYITRPEARLQAPPAKPELNVTFLPM